MTESVAGAVTHEQVKPTLHEETTEALDREVHQDHYHTTVQPVSHQEVQPEIHHHQMAGVQERETSSGDHHGIKQKAAETASQFQNRSETHDTKHTATAAPNVAGEHVHHHVHETIQPVIHKETITPEVVHTTVPIHEVHHAGGKDHGTSVLPMKNLSDLGGGDLTRGGQVSEDSYEGAPRAYEQSLNKLGSTGTGTGHESAYSSNTTAGPHSSNMANKADPRVDSDRDGSNLGGHQSRSAAYDGNQTDSRMDNMHNGEGLGNSSMHGSGRMGTTEHDGARLGNTTSGAGMGNTTSGTGMGNTTSGTSAGVSGPERGTDPSLTGGDNFQSKTHDGRKKTIGASGMADFTSRS